MKKIDAVSSSSMLASFIDFGHELYKNNTNYVPELFIAQRDLLTPGKHPFHDHSVAQLFLAFDNNKITGRIAAILNNNHNTFNKASDGFFGFFDCINDDETASLLFSAAEKWLKGKGVNNMIGPVNLSTNETCALLVEGFDSPPVAMMTYNEPYYRDLLERQGFQKKMDLLAYHFVVAERDERRLKTVDLIKERLVKRGIIFRPINLKKFQEETDKIREIYNAAWDKNLGFVPMTEKEFKYLAKDLKMILDKDFCMVAEHEGKMVGFSLAIPDVNQILIKIKKGRLFPTGIFKLLFQRKSIKKIRIITLGVIEGYRKMGIETVFYAEIIKQVQRKGITTAEASWVLEDNYLMNKAIQDINGKPYKKYRIFADYRG
jgi:GNAT superfamily N-acetyltransferase